MEITKAEINKLLVEERKKSRLKQKQSKFMSRTLSIYNGQKKRYNEKNNGGLPYTLEQLRELVSEAIGKPCIYSGEKLTVNNLAVDHATPVAAGGNWEIGNLQVISQKSNFRKGQLTAEEYFLCG